MFVLYLIFSTFTTAECFLLDNTTPSTLVNVSKEPCVDNSDIDCATVDALIELCHDIHHAKNVCRLYCNLCDVEDGKWTDWSSWSACDVTCSSGHMTRTRSCIKPVHGGDNCTGPDNEQKACLFGPCPVDGGWTGWGSWGSCSVTCGVGIQGRDRTCTNPSPDHFGDHCFGKNHDDKLCFPGHCSDGRWSAWTIWSSCSNTATSTGIKTRQRYCTNPAPSMLGNYCSGPSTQTQTCGDTYYPQYQTIHINGECCVEYTVKHPTSSSAYLNKIRLCDGDGVNRCNSRKGRIEVSLANPVSWGTVCDDGWDRNNNAANILCQSIGFSSGININRIPAPIWLPIHLDDIICNYTHSNIFDCTHKLWDDDDCNHNEDVAVMCI